MERKGDEDEKLNEGRDMSAAAKELKHAARLHAACSRMKEEALRDPTVKFLVNAIKMQGCSVKPDFFDCKACEVPVLGEID
jgi:hypothetical protein